MALPQSSIYILDKKGNVMTDKLLKNALLANATFSVLSGTGILLFTQELSKIFAGIAPIYLQILGVGLFIFAAYVLWVATKTPIVPAEAKAVTFADWGWVAGSVLLVIAAVDALSLLAIDLILGIALVVAVFAILQTKGLKRMQNTLEGAEA